jgi:hypothetical protein
MFDRIFPVLGSEFGVGALGLFQVFIGAAILSHHVNRFTLGSAFFLFVVGCVNAIVIGVWLREKAKSKRSITSWKEHSRSVLPSVGPYTSSGPAFVSHLYTGSSVSKGSSGCSERFDEKFVGRGFGRQGEKAKMREYDCPSIHRGQVVPACEEEDDDFHPVDCFPRDEPYDHNHHHELLPSPSLYPYLVFAFAFMHCFA